MEHLATTSVIITALGGNGAVARLTGSTAKAVSNWKALGAFPWRTQLTITSALNERGYSAPPELWGIKARVRAAA